MQQNLKKRWNEAGWGVIASVFIHVAIAAVLLLKLPQWPQEPPKDEAVNVELVPPPEEKPPEKPPEEKKAEAPKPPEKPPEAPKPEEKPAPPPPPPPPEQPKPEEKPPEAPKPADQQAEKPSDQAGKPQSMPVLRPVFEFGDKDTGPKKSGEGDSSVASTKPVDPPAEQPKAEPETPKPADLPKAEEPPKTEEPPKPVEPAKAAESPKPAETVATEPPPPSQQAPASPETPGNPVPMDIEVPQVEAATANPEKSGPAPQSSDEAKTDFALPPAPAMQSPKTETKDAPKPDALEKVKTLFSENATGDEVAKTAMGNVPRGARVGQLCSTELREQLRHSSPPYRPELLPAYRLSSGTVLDVRRGAFRAVDGWYNLSFRCEVDTDATKVVSFAFDVGDPVPRSEWQSRRLPAN